MPIISSILSRINNFFKSMKLALVLLLLVAAASIIGTIIPQSSLDATAVGQIWQNQPRLAPIYDFLGFFHVYTTWWYILLLAMLFLNIVVCTVPRFLRTLKSIMNPKTEASDKFINRLKNRASFESDKDIETLEPAIISSLKSHHFSVTETEKRGTITVSGHKGRFGQIGSLLFHLSFIILLFGVLLGKLTGMNSHIRLAEGDVFEVSDSGFAQMGVTPDKARFFTGFKPFTMEINDFDVKFLPSGQPETFVTTATIFESGKKIGTEKMWVNKPLSFNGIDFYQSSYGWIPIIEMMDSKGKVISKQAPYVSPSEGEPYPEQINFENGISGEVIFYTDYETGFPGARKPGIDLQLYDANNKPVLDGLIKLGQTAKIGDKKIKFSKLSQWTGLEIAKDAGVPIIWSAFIIGPLGLLVAFYLIYRRVWVNLRREGSKVYIHIGGLSDRNKLAFENEFNRLVSEIEASHKITKLGDN